MNRIKVTITLQLEARNPVHAGIAIAEVIRTLAPEQSTQVAKDLVKAIDIQLSEENLFTRHPDHPLADPPDESSPDA